MKNIYNATPAQQSEFLFRVIENELAKPEGEADEELIRECSELAGELLAPSERHSEAELGARFRKAVNKANKKKCGGLIFKLAAAAALFLIIFGALTAMRIISAADDVILIRNGKNERYDSLEKLIEALDEDILYPSYLSEGESMKNVILTDEGRGYSLRFKAPSGQSEVSVKNYYMSELSQSDEYYSAGKVGTPASDPYMNNISPLKNRDVMLINDKYTFYIYDSIDGSCRAFCQHEGFEYLITAENRDSLSLIIENLRVAE